MPDTPNVSLRPRTDDDLDLLFEIAADLDTWEERNPLPPRPLTRDRFDARLARGIDSDAAGDPVSLVIDVDGAAVGSASLFDFDFLARHAEAGVDWSKTRGAAALGRRRLSNSSSSGSCVTTCVGFTFRRSLRTSPRSAHTRRRVSSSRDGSASTPGFEVAMKTSCAWGPAHGTDPLALTCARQSHTHSHAACRSFGRAEPRCSRRVRFVHQPVCVRPILSDAATSVRGREENLNHRRGLPCLKETDTSLVCRAGSTQISPTRLLPRRSTVACSAGSSRTRCRQDSAGRYLLARLRGGEVAAISSLPEGAPAQATWNTYIWVDSADEAAAKARAAGGTVLSEPFDVMDAGRMAVLADTEGAAFCVWQARRHKGARIVNEAGLAELQCVELPRSGGGEAVLWRRLWLGGARPRHRRVLDADGLRRLPGDD